MYTFSPRLGKILAIISLNKLYGPFSLFLMGLLQCTYWPIWWCSINPIKAIFILWSFCSSNWWIPLSCSQLAESFIQLDLDFCCTSLLKFSVTVFFSSMINIWCDFIFLSVKILCALVSIFMTIILNSWFDKLLIYISLRSVSGDLLFLFVCCEHSPLFPHFLNSLS